MSSINDTDRDNSIGFFHGMSIKQQDQKNASVFVGALGVIVLALVMYTSANNEATILPRSLLGKNRPRALQGEFNNYTNTTENITRCAVVGNSSRFLLGENGGGEDLFFSEVCARVFAPLPWYSKENIEICKWYEDQPLVVPDCEGHDEIVPRIIHSVSKEAEVPYHQKAMFLANPSFQIKHHDDASALEYVREMCGDDAAAAYKCLVPGSYRADLFRFCAMFAEGGIYLDDDVAPLVPIDQLYSKCSTATVGNDYPLFDTLGKQMKILASAPGAPIFKCALEKVIDNVRNRYFPAGIVAHNPLLISGPSMLHQCYTKNAVDVAITYFDTHAAAWPFTGMRAGEKILAFEIPKKKEKTEDYVALFSEKKVYSDTCTLSNVKSLRSSNQA